MELRYRNAWISPARFSLDAGKQRAALVQVGIAAMWGRQSCLQPPFRRHFGACESQLYPRRSACRTPLVQVGIAARPATRYRVWLRPGQQEFQPRENHRVATSTHCDPCRIGVSGVPVRFSLALGLLACSIAPAMAAASPKPDFGPNVLLFNSSMPAAEMQQRIDKVYATQQNNQFGPARNAFLFAPGDYKLDIPIGYYTQVLGLGASPDSVHIAGNVHSDATLPRNTATCTFWKAAEGFSVTPTGGAMKWAVSQAVPFRRMHVHGDIVLHQDSGWASGGWMSDDLIDGNVGAGPQRNRREIV